MSGLGAVRLAAFIRLRRSLDTDVSQTMLVEMPRVVDPNELISGTAQWSTVFKHRRRTLGWSQVTAAREIDVSLATIQNWESGKTKPRWPEFLLCCAAFGWTIGFGDPACPDG